ncbi:MAG: hypothetical protein QOF78_1994 [Phycisphaerales bacterium]|nr:hypothetical protein [Phycisphaerales bacterium]
MRDLRSHTSAVLSTLRCQLLVIGAAATLLTGCALPKANTLMSPTPMQGSSGKFLNPYNADGALAPWAERGVGKSRVAAGVAGFAAAEAISFFVPIAEVSTVAENTIKQQAAIGAAGGTKYMKSTSETSFKRRQDLAVYLYANHSTKKRYKETLALVAEIYPDMWSHYDADIRKAKKKPKSASAAQ